MHHFCTYFDSFYAVRGLSLLRSLHRHSNSFRLHVLCLDDEVYSMLSKLDDEALVLLRLADLEREKPELARAKGNRSIIEYYFTISPYLPRWVLQQNSSLKQVTYLDSDLYFFGDPQKVFDEIGEGSVAMMPHRFLDVNKSREQFGHYNVGWLSFRNNTEGRACLDDWASQCLDWCYDKVEGERFADQKYLNAWPKKYPGTVVVKNSGANAAPWNIARYAITSSKDEILLDNNPLVFYHFEGMKWVNAYLLDVSALRCSACSPQAIKLVVNTIYKPYIKELYKAKMKLKTMQPIRLSKRKNIRNQVALQEIVKGVLRRDYVPQYKSLLWVL